MNSHVEDVRLCKPYKITFINTLYEYRMRMGYDIMYIARLLGKTKGYIEALESTRRFPQPRMRVQMLDKLKCSWSDIFREQGRPEKNFRPGPPEQVGINPRDDGTKNNFENGSELNFENGEDEDFENGGQFIEGNPLDKPTPDTRYGLSDYPWDFSSTKYKTKFN